jgi:hypothetical protein
MSTHALVSAMASLAPASAATTATMTAPAAAALHALVKPHAHSG